jgi:hypothetical protein
MVEEKELKEFIIKHIRFTSVCQVRFLGHHSSHI